MENLLRVIKNTLNENRERPFAVYTSIKEQNLLNVPIAKPLLIVVLSGYKELDIDNELTCYSGEFIFLSDCPAIGVRNIPKNKEYFALLIEFDYQDFNGLQINASNKKDYFIGKVTPTLEKCLQQFVEISAWTPEQVWSLRKREIISLLCHMGHRDILSLLSSPKIKNRLHEMFVDQGFHTLTIEHICEQLTMSESTLRRKLKLEGTSVQKIKDQARLGLAFHLLQTTRNPIGVIADKCGYQSQSRFTERFKRRFGLTPSELRKTKMTD
ncbi:Transcriptional regulator, AraC family [hydrothermal vent metagenome]|uniref:Transcriptional regulator, AraC family n=1 Tax=hydrothermal vent metagenome TaxID=652676 RepID=A0A3B0VK17_9ZZZZ